MNYIDICIILFGTPSPVFVFQACRRIVVFEKVGVLKKGPFWSKHHNICQYVGYTWYTRAELFNVGHGP